jgi:arylsulfatase A-like enzyme
MRHVRLAASVGLVGGFVLGCREAIVSLQANAMVQPGDYLLLYFAAPILCWMVLGTLSVLPVGLAVAQTRRSWAPIEALWLYALVIALVGCLSITLPSVAAIVDLLRGVGMPVGVGLHALLWALAVTLAIALAALVSASAAWVAPVVQPWLRRVTRAVAVVGLLLLFPVGRFFVTDWKWTPRTSQAAVNPSDAPNLLLISIDTLRADHLGSYGDSHGLTPSLDRLAGQGVSFRQAITSSPWTLPAMASLFTALYPRHHGAGAITNGRTPLGRAALPAGSWTLATALRQAGYRTQAIVSNPYLALRYGFGDGFDAYENVTIESEAFLAFSSTTAVRLLTWAWPDVVIGDRGATVSQRAVGWLNGVSADRPFFLWLHYIDPHPPYSRAGVTTNKSMRGDLSFRGTAADEGAVMLTSPDVARLRSGEILLNAAQKEAVRDLYRNEVRSVDAAVGAVLEALGSSGLRDRTLVVVVGDHGEEFWEHGGVEHGRTVYDEVVRVPLLMRWPHRLPAGRHVDDVVRMTDVAPTILDLLGVAVPSQRDGETLLPLVRGEPAAPRVALTENMLFAEARVGLRTNDRKYVRWENGKEEVYDLHADPRERRDLAGIDDAVNSFRRLYAEADAASGVRRRAAARPNIDGRTRDGLRSLGYIN